MKRFLWICGHMMFLAGMCGGLPETSIRIQAQDNDGNAVSNALVCCGFESGGSHAEVFYGYTDGRGEFFSPRRNAYHLFYHVVKDGYYGWYEGIRVLEEEGVVDNGVVNPARLERTPVLRSIRNSQPMNVVKMDYPGGFVIPVHDRWVGFDLMKSSWCPPYGHGDHEDILLRFRKRNTGSHFDFTYVMDICFTNNPHAGFYVLKKGAHSELETVYEADPSQKFTHSESFVREMFADGTRRFRFLSRDSYCVFRTRTKVDADGRLVSAHYGVINGEWSCGRSEMSMGKSWLNPTPNDTNLECAEIASRSQRTKRELYERKERATPRR